MRWDSRFSAMFDEHFAGATSKNQGTVTKAGGRLEKLGDGRRCAGDSDPCAGDSDPCAGDSDPCAASLDACPPDGDAWPGEGNRVGGRRGSPDRATPSPASASTDHRSSVEALALGRACNTLTADPTREMGVSRSAPLPGGVFVDGEGLD